MVNCYRAGPLIVAGPDGPLFHVLIVTIYVTLINVTVIVVYIRVVGRQYQSPCHTDHHSYLTSHTPHLVTLPPCVMYSVIYYQLLTHHDPLVMAPKIS